MFWGVVRVLRGSCTVVGFKCQPIFRETASVPPTPQFRSIAGYQLIPPKIGAGSFGTVWRARDTNLDRIVALKELQTTYARNPEDKRRFLIEARVAASLSHPNIPIIYHVGDFNGRLYIAMQLVVGSSLEALVSVHGTLTLERTLAVLRGVASALDHAHALNVVHRDVKPANILVQSDDHSFLVDFGLARLTVDSDNNQVRQSLPAGAGTPSYLSPEQFLGNDPSPASDRYALGVTAFELLTGCIPYDTDMYSLKGAVVNDPVPSVRSLRPDCPSGVDRAIQRMMAKDPADRWVTSMAFVDELSAQLGLRQLPLPPRPSSQIPPPVDYPVKTLPRRVAVAERSKIWRHFSGSSKPAPDSRGRMLGSFDRPSGITVASDGRLFIADVMNNRVVVLWRDGRAIATWGKHGTEPGDFVWPRGVSVSVDGNVYVADTGNHRIQVLSDTGQTASMAWGKRVAGSPVIGNRPGEFSRPSAVAVGVDGKVFVADTGNHRIQVLSATGTPIAQWTGADYLDMPLASPQGVAIAPDRTVFVTDWGNDRVVAFDPSGRSRVVLGGSAGGASALSGPVGISVAANGDIHVADTDNNRIVVMARDGLVVSMWPVVTQEPDGDPVTKPGWFAGPEGICITRDGRTFVTDTANHRVQVLQ